MNCQDYRDLLSAYLDRELHAENQRDVASHLASCAACRQDLSSLAILETRQHLGASDHRNGALPVSLL